MEEEKKQDERASQVAAGEVRENASGYEQGDSRENGTKRDEIAERAFSIRHHLKIGRGRKEICSLLGISKAKYRYALRWLGMPKQNNHEAFGDYAIGEQGRLEEIELDIQHARLKGDVRAVATLQRLSFDVRVGITDMAMKLGVLDKAAVKIEHTEADAMAKALSKVAEAASKLTDENARIAYLENLPDPDSGRPGTAYAH